MTRIEYIQLRIEREIVKAKAVPCPVSLEKWLEQPQTNLRVRFGVRRIKSDIGEFCPELIDHQTAHLNFKEMDLYLAGLCFALSSESLLHEMDDNSATRLVEEIMAESMSRHLHLMSEVQMKWMDNDF